ncbi:MAG: NAD-dependent epimerase/dehydratase family protein [Tannerellaceae bacterium]|nr:NAD-dependent epimerase/dehydratase family protein [Tannerellaceae bacterium]
MKVLVTGGAGSTGYNLCETLLNRGNHVTCMADSLSGKIEYFLPLICLYPLTFSLIEGDLCRMAVCRQAVAGKQCVIHDVQIGNILYLLIASRDAGVTRFVYCENPDQTNLQVINQYIPDVANQVYNTTLGYRTTYKQQISNLLQ